MKFKELDKRKVSEVENSVLESWGGINKITDAQTNKRKKNKNFVFYDGPATANGMPGVHHILAKLLKDTIGKYKSMQGYKVLRKVGWDTHGLPVEVQVEKELGFSGKNDIEKYGIKEFNQKCRESVWKNEKAFREFTEKLGQFIDLENPYITYDNGYIETEWWILKKFFDAGLIYDGLKILPYCPRCGTGLASHEVAQGYKEVSVNTVTVPFKVKSMDNTYLLIWTTTPWTLLANVAACVNPDEKYVKCLSKGYNFIVAEKLANKVLGDEYKVVEEYTGKDLEYLEYEQFLPFLPVNGKAFYVTCDNYVTMEDGTGIVHLAPAFGQDDYEVGLRYNLPLVNPVDENGCYTMGPWKGRLVVDSDLELEIIKYLSENDKLFRKQKMIHNYPHCWRCHTPLVYYSKPSLYIKVTDLKDKIIAANKKVNWYPDYVGEKRFGNWLENLNDWAISRNRYWGTPIPLWRCECGHDEMIGSREELIQKSIEEIDNIDLHRPYVDDVHIICPKCGKQMSRINEVIDCWFDSGAMPFAQYHYPFENQKLWKEQFPADFISEGIDQTRGWFYSLIVISVFLEGCSPYKNVLVNDLVLDKYGQKMHKSKGNAVEPFSVLEKYGADAVRFYMLHTSPVWTPLKFDEDGIKEIQSKVFGTLKNTYTFFQMYANADKIDPREFNVKYDSLEEIDKWLLSKYNKLVDYVTKSMDEYDLNKVCKAINLFINEDLSNWYIRRNRRRFWDSELTVSKKAVYQTTYEVLVGLCKLMAPISPFITEEIYRNLTGEKSVHLADYPKFDKTKVVPQIEKRMDLVRDLISLGRNAREEAKIKVRQPISEVILDGKHKRTISDLVDLIKEELNVKEVRFENNLAEYINFIVKPNFKEVGKVLGPKIKLFQDELTKLDSKTKLSLKDEKEITIKLDGEDFAVTPSMVEIRVESKEGFNASYEGNNFIVLNTTLTNELVNEGLARETVSKIQQIRKNNGFDIADRVKVYYEANEEYTNNIKDFIDFIKDETLALEFNTKSGLKDEYDINEYKVKFKVVKNK